MKKYGKTILKFLISGVLFTIIFLRIDREALFSRFASVDLAYVPLVLLLIVANYVISSIRWKYLLVYRNAEKVSVKYLTFLYFIGSFFNNFMPTSIGGDVFKIYRLGKKLENITDAFSSTFMERFTGVVVLMLISVLALKSIIGWAFLLLFAVVLVGFLVGFKLLKLLSARFTKLKKIYDSLYAYRYQPRVLVIAIVTSLIVQLVAIFTQYFIFAAVGVKLPVLYSLLVFPVVTLASFFVPSLNGIGVQDVLYMQLFSIVGVSAETSLSASILYHLFRLGASLIGGVLYALGKDE